MNHRVFTFFTLFTLFTLDSLPTMKHPVTHRCRAHWTVSRTRLAMLCGGLCHSGCRLRVQSGGVQVRHRGRTVQRVHTMGGDGVGLYRWGGGRQWGARVRTGGGGTGGHGVDLLHYGVAITAFVGPAVFGGSGTVGGEQRRG